MSELPNSLLFAIIAVLTVLSAFFSSSETAMIGLNRYRLRHLVKEKHRGARKANSLLRRPDRLLGVILIGNNLANFMAASVATIIGLRLFGDSGVVTRRSRLKHSRLKCLNGSLSPLPTCSHRCSA
jgi:Mg2+/Co2+ transporter CorB